MDEISLTGFIGKRTGCFRKKEVSGKEGNPAASDHKKTALMPKWMVAAIFILLKI
jgi:hypothetical protein